MHSSPHRAILLSSDYNYVAFGMAVVVERTTLLGRRVHQGPGSDSGAWAKLSAPVKTYYTSARTKVTFRWTGADTVLQVLTSGWRSYEIAAADRRWRVGQLRRHEGHVTDRDMVPWSHLPVPRPRPRLGRQLGRLADDRPSRSEATRRAEPGPDLTAELAMAGEPRPGDPRRARRTGHGPSAPPRTPRRIPAP